MSHFKTRSRIFFPNSTICACPSSAIHSARPGPGQSAFLSRFESAANMSLKQTKFIKMRRHDRKLSRCYVWMTAKREPHAHFAVSLKLQLSVKQGALDERVVVEVDEIPVSLICPAFSFVAIFISVVSPALTVEC